MLYKNLLEPHLCEMAVKRLEEALILGPHKNTERESTVNGEPRDDKGGVIRADADTAMGCYNLFRDIQDHIHEKVEEAFDKELLPTYNYSRIYYKGDVLALHSDRPACECSVTLNVGNTPTDQMWPFGVRESFQSEQDIYYNMSQGDAVVYYGIDQPHWRNPLEYEKCYQIFVHYVDANGPHAEQHLKETLNAKRRFL